MRVHLADILALAGRLTDQPGPDSARERFRRFLTSWTGSLDDLADLIDHAQRTPDDQSQRALMDLVVTVGRYLGFVVSYGTYERRSGAVRFDGAWRSPGVMRVVLEVRTDRTRPFSPDDLSRTIAALPDAAPADATEPTHGVCIVVPLHGRRRVGDAPREPATQGLARVLPLHAVLMLARRVEAGTLDHAQAAELLTGVEDDARAAVLLGEPVDAAAANAPVRAVPPGVGHLSLVPREDPPDYWIATMLPEEGTAPGQFVEAVVRGRQLLGVSAIGIFPATARPGDWVCFFMAGTGIVGHGRLARELAHDAAPLRDAGRYTAVFTLAELQFYDTPHALDPASPAQRLADRVPFDVSGPFLTQITQAEFHAITASGLVTVQSPDPH
ncbi:MAG: hypothetical protein U0Q55_12960 [Vicinamibacterales bacterium]